MSIKFTWKPFKKRAKQRAKETDTNKTVGSVLRLDLPLLNIEHVKAKVDTGAFSGALHATQMREITDKKGNKRLRFYALGKRSHKIETSDYHTRKVKSSSGHLSIRYAIDTQVTILGATYPITLTLTDRKGMRYEMLIGRKFLRLHGFLVDVTRRSK